MPNPFQVPSLCLSWIGHDQDTHGGKGGSMQACGVYGVKNKNGTFVFSEHQNIKNRFYMLVDMNSPYHDYKCIV